MNGSGAPAYHCPALQWEAQQACEPRSHERRSDCTVVIIQPETGYVLAMAQWPTYNPGVSAIRWPAPIWPCRTCSSRAHGKVITAPPR